MNGKLSEVLKKSGSVVFFGGAGVSTESGVPDFRGAGGIYSREYSRPPEEILSRGFFMENTAEFYRFYRERMLYPGAKPNPAHYALAAMEKEGKLKAVVTQNIDGLHQLAGSVKVYELHGSVQRNTCLRCGRKYGLRTILESDGVPRCEVCGGIIKPDVVLYGEPLDAGVMSGAARAISQCDTLIVAGTSLSVYPAAGLIEYFRGSELVLINLTATHADSRAGLLLREKVGEALGGYPGGAT